MVLKEVLIVTNSMVGVLSIYAFFAAKKISQLEKDGFLALGILLLASVVLLATREAWDP